MIFLLIVLALVALCAPLARRRLIEDKRRDETVTIWMHLDTTKFDAAMADLKRSFLSMTEASARAGAAMKRMAEALDRS